MQKLNESTIKQIQSTDWSAREVARQLWVSVDSVIKYRKQLNWVLNWKEEKDFVANKLSKDEQKKLDLLKTYSPKDIQEMLSFIWSNVKREVSEVLGEEWRLRFWMLSDTHVWAKQCAMDEIGEFYDKAKDKWVECFVHAGDILDWEWVYKWQQFEQSEVGMDAQIDKLVKEYPNVWVPTFFIEGNHDAAFLSRNWADVWRTISLLRDDLKYLGIYDATLKINWIKINLHHGAGTSSYSGDYRLLRYIDSLDPNNLPDIVALGHYHRALMSLHNWVQGFLPGAFLKTNLLCKRYNFPNIIWGWIVDIEKTKDWKQHLNMEFIKL